MRPARTPRMAPRHRPPQAKAALRRSQEPKARGGARGFLHRDRGPEKPPAAPLHGQSYVDRSACSACGALYTRKTWRRPRVLEVEILKGVAWTVCPACRQMQVGEALGRVVIEGEWALLHEDDVLHRVDNVAARAEFTQPERRVLFVVRQPGGLEVHTTSQELAHRIAHELAKAFGGRADYSWSDREGRLLARWRV